MALHKITVIKPNGGTQMYLEKSSGKWDCAVMPPAGSNDAPMWVSDLHLEMMCAIVFAASDLGAKVDIERWSD